MDARHEQAAKMLRKRLEREGQTMTQKEFEAAVDYIVEQSDEKGRERG